MTAKDQGPTSSDVERMREATRIARRMQAYMGYPEERADAQFLAAYVLSLSREREGEQVTLRKRPIAWMRYNCGSAEFQHTTFQRDPPEDEGWIALYRRGQP
jgi:hypothetical protein